MPDKLLTFPEDVSVGSIWIEPGDRRVDARGLVRIPEGSVAHFSPDSPVRGLSLLPPDAFYGVHPPKKRATDEDLERIAHLTGLRQLNLSKAWDVTDRGVAALAGMTQMRCLDLYWTGITDAALASLAKMTHLEYIHIGQTQIKGPGLVHLAALQRLESLSVENTDVDDHWLRYLKGLHSLKRLVLWGTRISFRGLADIKAALPNTQMSMRDPGRRLAEELGTRAINRILVRRLRPDLPLDVDPDEHLQTLMERGLLQWRLSEESPGGRPFAWDPARFAIITKALLGSGLCGDYRLVTPEGPGPWFPWLRRRRRERRRHAGPRFAARNGLDAV